MKKQLVEHYRLVILAMIVVVIVGVGFFRLISQETSDVPEDPFGQEQLQSSTIETTQQTGETSEGEGTQESGGTSYVNIKGAVAVPGVYQIAEGDRLQDVVQLAGGFTKEADDRQINLSAKVTDQQLIYIPKVGEKVIPGTETSVEETDKPMTEGNEEAGGKVNLNTADSTQLQTLSGIGAKKAEEIIKYREENGRFKTISDLSKISGIGEKTVEKLKNSITI